MNTIDKIAEKKLQELYLPKNTEEWLNALRYEDVKKLRKLLKKTRATLPKKYGRLYLESDDKLLLLLHFLRTRFPFFSKEEKAVSINYINLNQKVAEGFNPLEIKPTI